jgi:hypothetical protein
MATSLSRGDASQDSATEHRYPLASDANVVAAPSGGNVNDARGRGGVVAVEYGSGANILVVSGKSPQHDGGFAKAIV